MFLNFYKYLKMLAPLLLVLGALEVQAQGITVTGNVSEPAFPGGLPGVSVVEKGTTNGTATDAGGNYRITVPNAEAVLVFSYLGYVAQEIVVGNRSTIDVGLAQDKKALDEVVIVGFGTTKKVNLTGAVDVAKGERLANRPIVNVAEGMQGVLANVNVTIPSGDPTANARFNVRGFESINGGAPLILVDNVPMDLNRINPEDIESITVLKDGAAAAIYGARAAFGVILVKTKTGQKGMNVRFSTQHSVLQPIWHVDPIENGYEYALERNAINERDGSTPTYGPAYMDGLKRYWDDPANNPAYEVVNGSFQNYAYNNLANSLMSSYSPRQKHDFALSGASDKASYYTSFGLLNTDGYINSPGNDNFKRYNVLMKGDYKVKDWLRLDQSITINIQKSDQPSEANINDVIRTEPIRPFVVPRIDGYEQFEGMYWNHAFLILPQLAHGGRETFNNSDIWLNSGVTLTPLKRLTINSTFAYNVFSRSYENALPRYEVVSLDLSQDNPVNWVGPDRIDVQRQFNQGYVSNSYAEYKIDDIKDHFILGMVGFNQEYQYNTRVGGSSNTLLSPSLTDIGATTGIQQITGGKTEAGLRGVFYRFNYNFKERYFLESNGRYDGTSRFPKKDRFGFFPSFGLGWRISEEPFMAGTRNVIDNLKLRATYGSLGNQLLGNNFYPYIPSMPSGFSNYVMSTGMIPTVRMPGLVSPTLTWEEVVSQNVGIDVILLNNRLETSFEVYTRDTKQMLMRRTYPSILGTGAPQENAADLRTTGWEFILKWRDNVGRDLNYWLDFNLSDWTSKITKFENPTGAIGQYYVGQQLGEIWGYETVGIIQNEEQLNSMPDQSRLGNGWRVGDMQYADLDGDGIISQGNGTLDNPGDRRIIGNANPRYSFGFNSGVSYKNFSVDIFLQGVGRRDYNPSSGNWTWFYPWRSYNGEKSWLTDTWAPDRPDAYFPASSLGSMNFHPQTRFLQDASYLRLKNVNVSYSLPKSVVKMVGIGDVRVYVGAQNLWEFSRIRKPLDPEYIFSGSINYPLFRIYTAGLVVNL
jgi:TonB-linked SusC/RagA family outer membrane protein